MKTLKTVLLINSLSSGATGILLILLTGDIAQLFRSEYKWPFLATGIFLLLFALPVYYASTLRDVRTPLINTVIVLDALWVLASLIVVVTGSFNLSLIGYILITAVAAWVALMAYLQNKNLKKILLNQNPTLG